MGLSGAEDPQDCAHLPAAHVCLCTHSPCTFWAPGFPSLTTAKSLFQALSPAWQRIRCSSTESKQLPFRGSKYFATCYFSLIYYEHIFPFIRGFANSPESQNLAAASRRAAVPLLPPAIPGGSREVSPSPGSPPGEGDALQEPGIIPCSFPGTPEVGDLV